MYGCASMYGCFGALHPCSANMLRVLRCHILRYQAVWPPPLFTACVSVTCVACACSWGWATHGLLIVISTGVPWVSCRDPPVCSRCPGSMASVAERQLVLCWVVLCRGVWWCVVHVVVWIVSSLCFVMCPLAPLLDMVTAVALSILRDTSHHSWLISLADTTDFRLWMLQLLLLINTSDSACCTFTRLNLTLGVAHHHSGFEDLQCFLQRQDFLLSGCCTVGVRDTRVNTSVSTPISKSSVLNPPPGRNWHQEGWLFLCSSRSFWSTFTQSRAPSNGFVCLVELQHLFHRPSWFLRLDFSVNLTVFRIAVHSQLLNFLAQLRAESLLNSCMSAALSIWLRLQGCADAMLLLNDFRWVLLCDWQVSSPMTCRTSWCSRAAHGDSHRWPASSCLHHHASRNRYVQPDPRHESCWILLMRDVWRWSMCCCSPFSAVVVDPCCYLHLSRRSASGPSQLFGPAFRRFPWILKNLLKVDQPFASQRVFTTHWISQRAFSSVTVFMWLHQPESSSPVCFPSLTRSVDTQVSRSRFVTEDFICTLGTHGLCPVPAISNTVSNWSLSYMPSMTQCKRSFDSVT